MSDKKDEKLREWWELAKLSPSKKVRRRALSLSQKM
jgi:hypothetical protein